MSLYYPLQGNTENVLFFSWTKCPTQQAAQELIYEIWDLQLKKQQLSGKITTIVIFSGEWFSITKSIHNNHLQSATSCAKHSIGILSLNPYKNVMK